MFLCASCLHKSKKYIAHCPACGSWNCFATPADLNERGVPLPLSYVEEGDGTVTIKTGLKAFDEVMSNDGGFARGGIYMLSGDPGAGKSTSSIQIAVHVAEGHRVVYCSTEERKSTLRARAKRLGLDAEQLLVVQSDSVEELIQRIGSADLAILDSLQGMSDKSGVPVEQIALALRDHGHETDTAWLLINHIIKSGDAAGAEKLQHDVDATLHMTTAGAAGAIRSIVSPKNRFGPAHVPFFLRMTGTGLKDIPDATSYLLADRLPDEPGSVVAATVMPKAQTALLVEVQAATAMMGEREKQQQIAAIGYPTARLRNVIMSALSRRAGVDISDQHVSVSVSGGMSIDDPGLDLPIALAIVSSLNGRPVDPKLCAWGELGLVGEVRASREHEARERETARAGFKQLPRCRRLREAIEAAGLGAAPATQRSNGDVPVSASVGRGAVRPASTRSKPKPVSGSVQKGARRGGEAVRGVVAPKARGDRKASRAGSRRKSLD